MRRKWFYQGFPPLLIALLLHWVALGWWQNIQRRRSRANKPHKTSIYPAPQKPQKVIAFHYDKFATFPVNFKAWFDYLFEWLPLPIPITSIIIGGLVYL